MQLQRLLFEPGVLTKYLFLLGKFDYCPLVLEFARYVTVERR
jgi:hypothetical protein